MKITLEPLDVTVKLLLAETGAAASKAVANYARQEFARAEGINRRALGYSPEHKTWVDGTQTENLESVKPNGRIVFEWQLADDAMAWIAAMLELHSPVGPPAHGHYAEDHVFFADGVQFDPHGTVPTAERYVAVNIRPYARKIEGSGNRPPLSLQAPHGVYQVVAAMAQERFKRTYHIKFTYETVNKDRNPAISIKPR